MSDVGAIGGGISFSQFFLVVSGLDGDFAADHGEEFASSLKVWCAFEDAGGTESDFVEFDIFFEMQWAESSNAHVLIRPIVVGGIATPYDDDVGVMLRVPYEFIE